MTDPAPSWGRDGVLAGLGINGAAVGLLAGFLAWKDPTDIVDSLLDHRFVLLVSVCMVSGFVLGGIGGPLLGFLHRRLGGHLGLVLGLGFPLGALAGIVVWQALWYVEAINGRDLWAFAVLCIAGGSTSTGATWALYAVLLHADRPGWAAAALAPLIAIVALFLLLGTVLWVGP